MTEQIFKKESKKAVRRIALAPLVAIFIAVASLYSVVVIFSLPTQLSLPIICILCGVAAAWGSDHFQVLREKKWLIYSAIAGIYILSMIALGNLFTDGIAAVINQIIDTVKQLHPYNYEFFNVESSLNTCVGLVLCMGAFAGGIAAYEYVKQPRMLSAMLCILLDAVILIVFSGIMPIYTVIILILKMGIVGLLYVGEDYRQLRVYVENAGARVWLRMSAIFILTFLIGSAIVPVSDTDLVTRLSEGCVGLIDELRYGDNFDDGLTDGDLSKAGSLHRSSEDVLKVTMSNPQSYYLRGFIGECYEKNKWKTLAESNKESLYENGDLFYWLHHDGFFGQNQLVNAALAAGNIFEDEAEEAACENQVNVENLSASSKYIYLPYELYMSDELDKSSIGDGQVEGSGVKGVRSYSFDASKNIVTKYQKIAGTLAKQAESSYMDNESGYNAFVYENYIELPSDIAQFFSEKLGDYVIESGQRHFDYQMAKQNILYYLGKTVKYSDETDDSSGDIDFVLKFLDGSKTGYDVHYATAAVMMFRYYGIPARYAEGYLITKVDAAEMKADEPFYIDGTHAHAWAEYYQDGVGWLPFEVTPTYMSVMGKMETYKDISGMLGQTVGSKQAENQEEQQATEPEESTFEMFWIKNKVTILFVVVMMLFLLLIGLFVWWIVRERMKVAKRKASFMDNNIPQGIKNIYEYMVDVIHAGEIAVEEIGLGDRYRQVYDIWEEAKFSNHKMEEVQRQAVLELNEVIWQRTWQDASLFKRIVLKYIYFL